MVTVGSRPHAKNKKAPMTLTEASFIRNCERPGTPNPLAVKYRRSARQESTE